MVTLDEVRALASTLPRSYEALVRGRVKFRVGRIVYLAFSKDERQMGFAFPKEWRQALVESEPEKFSLPDASDMRYNWAVVRLDAIDEADMRELVLDAWAMVVPKKVIAEYREEHRLSSAYDNEEPVQEVTMSARKTTQKSAKSGKTSTGFTAEERAAMKARAQELKAEARASKDREAGERAVLAAIAEMPGPDRAMAKRLHALIKASAPDLSPRTWYGMPAYAKDGKVVCFFKGASKFKERYATFGFNDTANLDQGAMWPVVFALKELTAAGERKIAALVKKAVS